MAIECNDDVHANLFGSNFDATWKKLEQLKQLRASLEQLLGIFGAFQEHLQRKYKDGLDYDSFPRSKKIFPSLFQIF